MRRDLARTTCAATGLALVCGLVVGAPAQARFDQGPVGPVTGSRALTVEQQAEAVYAAMTPTERVGQLFMAGVPTRGATKAQLATLRRYRIGNVYLAGATARSRAKVAASVTKVRSATTWGYAEPFVSIDQEGGAVQRLTGKGFSRMPSALAQGRLTPTKLRVSARVWGRQLAAAGVNVDLAPVADTVPRSRARTNKPIGVPHRAFAHTPGKVATHVVAFARGLGDAGVASTLKHFPGLGRASGNTDLKRRVTEPTSRTSRYLRPFRDGVAAGAPFVMVSAATYPNIDPSRRACFSRTVMVSLLRRDLGFDGVILSDAVSAASMAGRPPGERATRFLGAGGTMVLDTVVDRMGAMARAVRAEAVADAAFAALVKAAVMRVLVAKVDAGLVG